MQIQVLEGTWNDTLTTETNLINANVLDPTAGFDEVLMYSEKRQLMTFLTAGATNGAFTVSKTTDTYATKIPIVPQGELIGANAWKFRIMGRIQKAIEIMGSAAIGSITAGSKYEGGFFYLALKTDDLHPGMNGMFWNKKIARCVAHPSGGPGNWIYKFQCYPGDTFSWATWVAPQTGTKTLFGGFTTYGERSLRGYGQTFYPDTFIQHFTTQRKGIDITGDANADKVRLYKFQGATAWDYWISAQARAQFLLEDEFQKWFGQSTMKDSDGNLLDRPSMYDEETKMPIFAGDGYHHLIKGANDLEASGNDGMATYDDFADMLSMVKEKTESVESHLWYVVTGRPGMQNASDIIESRLKTNYNFTVHAPDNSKLGGADMPVGFNFRTLNVGGDQMQFVENPMFDDKMKFPARLTNGKSVMGSTYYFMDAGILENGRRNIEIRAKGRNGVNRNLVTFYRNGMTGEGTSMDTVDAKEYQVLKQNMFVCYNTKSNGIISPNASA